MLPLSKRKKIHRNIYLFLLLVACLGLLYSRAALSMAQIGLLINWVAEGNFKAKIQILKAKKSILVFSSIWILHILGLAYTQDFQFALRDIQIKIPLLILPIIIGTSAKISFTTFKKLIFLFSIALIIKTLYSSAILFGLTGVELTDIRQIAFKFSHVRFALLLNLSLFFLLGFSFFRQEKKYGYKEILSLLAAAWLSIFLILFLKSTTGLLLWGALSLLLFFFILKGKSRKLKKIAVTFIALGIIASLSYFAYTVSKFMKTEKYSIETLEKKTKLGHPYWHNTKSKQRENGHFSGIYLCEQEIKKAWNSKSKIPYSGHCNDGNIIKYTLIRYMTSKGLRKDAEGFQQLSSADIHNVENGLGNYIYANKFSLYPKLYKVYWQIEAYANGANPSGHSVTQRIEFYRVGLKILSENLLFGVGTGDLQEAYNAMYEKTQSVLAKEFRLRAHNQYLTFFIAFGILGGTYALFALFYPIFAQKRYTNYTAMVVIVTGFASMLDEDTLEGQIGVTFFVLFYCLVIWGIDFDKNIKKQNN